MATITDITAKFDTLKPGLAADFVQYVTTTLEGLLTRYPEGLRNLGNSWGADGHAFRNFRRFLKSDGAWGYTGVDAEVVAKAAKTYADDQVAAFTLKLNKKLAGLTDVELIDTDVHGYTCKLRGKLGEREVVLEQRRIINVSVNGNLFHQWPALIYVDGRKTSEAQFKKLAP